MRATRQAEQKNWEGKSWEMRYLRQKKLLKVPMYMRESRRTRACSGLNTCSENT